MSNIYYDVLPIIDGYLLRCAANGRVSFRSNLHESKQEFANRCARYVNEKCIAGRVEARLRIPEEE